MGSGEVQDAQAGEGGRAKAGGKKQARLELFVHEYLIDLNGTKAAIRAGAAEKSAAVTASRWLKYPWVKAEIKRELARRKKRLKLTAERFDEELAKVAYSNLFDYMEPDGAMKLGEVNLDQAAAIAEIKFVAVEMAGQNAEPPKQDAQSEGPAGKSTNAGGPAITRVEERLEPQPHGGALKRSTAIPGAFRSAVKSFKLHSKTKALELMGKRLQLFSEKVEHSGKVTLVVDQ